MGSATVVWVVGFARGDTRRCAAGGFHWGRAWRDVSARVTEHLEEGGGDIRVRRVELAATTPEEITSYLDEHPELWEPGCAWVSP